MKRRHDYDDIREYKGYRFGIRFEPDYDHGAPWEESDGHGIVSEWTTRDKEPGERVLVSDYSHKRYYNVVETLKIAKREGWDAPPYGGKKGEKAARAVQADFEYLRQWCNDQWRYAGVIVEQLDDDDNPTGIEASLWGVETYKDYHEKDVVPELLDECMAQIEVETPDIIVSEN